MSKDFQKKPIKKEKLEKTMGGKGTFPPIGIVSSNQGGTRRA